MPKAKTRKKRKAQSNVVAGLAPAMPHKPAMPHNSVMPHKPAMPHNSVMPRNIVAEANSAMSGSRQEMPSPAMPVTTPRRPPSLLGGSGRQGLVMSALVALGCWGMAISFGFFSADPNHYLYAGMAAVMGLMWSFSFGLRIRRDRFIASTSTNDMQSRRRTR